jgi:hypothetical protein
MFHGSKLKSIKTRRLIFAASPKCTQNEGARAKIVLLGIRLMCSKEATRLPTNSVN